MQDVLDITMKMALSVPLADIMSGAIIALGVR